MQGVKIAMRGRKNCVDMPILKNKNKKNLKVPKPPCVVEACLGGVGGASARAVEWVPERRPEREHATRRKSGGDGFEEH